MTFNSMSDIRSTFNSDWASKVIIDIGQSFDSNRKEDSEKIKNLSTAMTFKLEAKGQDRFEIEFFGKIILCSNNERNFILMDQAEIRYWVRKILTIPKALTEIITNTCIDEFFFTNGNLKTLMERNKVKVSKGELTHIIKNKWKLQPVPNASGYTTYLYDRNGIFAEYQLKGRYYSIRKRELERIYVNLLL